MYNKHKLLKIRAGKIDRNALVKNDYQYRLFNALYYFETFKNVNKYSKKIFMILKNVKK